MMTMVVMMRMMRPCSGGFKNFLSPKIHLYPPISLSTTRSQMSIYITCCSLSGEEHPPQREHHNGRHLQRSARHQTKVSRSELFRYLNGDQVTIEICNALVIAFIWCIGIVNLQAACSGSLILQALWGRCLALHSRLAAPSMGKILMISLSRFRWWWWLPLSGFM